jgi:hypothetical protein
VKNRHANVHPGQYAMGLGSQHAGSLYLRRDHGLGGGVVESLVFGDGGIDQCINVWGKLAHGTPSLLTLKKRWKPDKAIEPS